MKDVREEYQAEQLDELHMLPDPLDQARLWVDQAIAAELPLANAMTLATADSQGRPSCRTVLLKGIEDGGFVFFTHYDSRKGREIEANPHVALTMLWEPFSRQITITGEARKLSREASVAYFASRPRGSQLSAAVSPQSRPVPSRDWLEAEQRALADKIGEGEIPMPMQWGGYSIVPREIQFWHGRPDRLHDRFCYLRGVDGSWHRERLAP